jgi:hypothetical protein
MTMTFALQGFNVVLWYFFFRACQVHVCIEYLLARRSASNAAGGGLPALLLRLGVLNKNIYATGI